MADFGTRNVISYSHHKKDTQNDFLMMAHFLIYIKRGQAKGKIVFVTDDGMICKVISIDKDKPMIVEGDEVSGKNL